MPDQISAGVVRVDAWRCNECGHLYSGPDGRAEAQHCFSSHREGRTWEKILNELVAPLKGQSVSSYPFGKSVSFCLLTLVDDIVIQVLYQNRAVEVLVDFVLRLEGGSTILNQSRRMELPRSLQYRVVGTPSDIESRLVDFLSGKFLNAGDRDIQLINPKS